MPRRILRVAEIGLRVADLEAMTAFYRDVVGFPVHKTGDGHIFLEIGALPGPLGDGGHPQLLALFERGNPLDVGRSTLDHLAFEVDPDDYFAEMARYADMGMVIRERVWPDTLLWPGRSFFFRDPEGNVLEIIAAVSDTAG